ncbi:MAG: ankyrin repeat domain-containing protein [Thiobacillaceae bacterium]|nr:ankyrin repeat domain-containing protein [Thiobacillaceae bacterium]MCX7673241.1 ankyrin repeat domain-containing protein [Thiobacillaceae bacterium]MDW8324427.1 ankyrin repeat domain-containing protein [Burkholderiales bacterium]
MSAELLEAARAGDTARLTALLAAGVSPDWADENGMTALMAAAQVGQLEAVQALIAAGADVNRRDAREFTALFYAVHNPELDCGFAPVVQALVDAGADVNARIFFGITPLMLAAGGGEGAVCEVLIKAGADVHAVNDGGRTALAMAKERHWVDVINLLHEATGFVPETEGACASTGHKGPSEAKVINFVRRPLH